MIKSNNGIRLTGFPFKSASKKCAYDYMVSKSTNCQIKSPLIHLDDIATPNFY